MFFFIFYFIECKYARDFFIVRDTPDELSNTVAVFDHVAGFVQSARRVEGGDGGDMGEGLWGKPSFRSAAKPGLSGNSQRRQTRCAPL